MSSTLAAGPNSSRCSPADLSGASLSRLIWRDKYRAQGETGIVDSWRRVAEAVASVEHDSARWRRRFCAILADYSFLPGGRVLAGAGRPGAVLFNCFVLPGPSERVDASLAALQAVVTTLRAGGGVGCDFSRAPPAGWIMPDGPSPGPVGYLELWDGACRAALAEASRQGAMMGVLRCDHPDIKAFAAAKRAPGMLSRFNLSVGITDAFMAAVEAGRDWPLRYPRDGDVVRTVPARRLWDDFLRCAYDTGEPGVLFLDRINAVNNLSWRERIYAANPCGEVPLPDHGACDLGSLNLTRFVRAPFTRSAALDFAALAATAATAVRLLDDVIDLSAYPSPEQARTVKASRRLGLGVTGLADALVMLGQRYGEPASLATTRRALRVVRDAAYRSSVRLAREKGAFPAFDGARYLEADFVRRLPAGLRQSIADHGIRNSHLLAVAPAGSISLLAGGVSSGVEPIFSAVQRRRIRGPDGRVRSLRVIDPAVALWRRTVGRSSAPAALATARDLPVAAHLAMAAAVQSFVDNGVSKTVNVPLDITFEAFSEIYTRAYRLGLKGCTAFRPTREAVLTETVCATG